MHEGLLEGAIVGYPDVNGRLRCTRTCMLLELVGSTLTARRSNVTE